MKITRFSVHVINHNIVVASVSGQTHVIGQFAGHIGEFVHELDNSTMGQREVDHIINSHMKNSVDQNDTRRVVISAGDGLELVITPLFSAIGGV